MRGEPNTPPAALEYLLGWYNDLSYDREAGMGTGYIKSSEYEAWGRLNGVALGVVEARILKAIDREFVLFHSSKDDEPAGEEPPSIMSSLKTIAEQNGRQ